MRRVADASCVTAHFSFRVQQTLAVGVKGTQGAHAQQRSGFVGVQFGARVHFADGTSALPAVVQRTARTENAFGLWMMLMHFTATCNVPLSIREECERRCSISPPDASLPTWGSAYRRFALRKRRLKPAATFCIPCVFEHTPRPFAMAQGDRNEMLHSVQHDSLSIFHIRREEACFPAYRAGV